MNSDFSARLRTLIATLSTGLVERDAALRACVLALLAGEHVLLLGPPGTAKSLLARRVHTAVADARYFERLLTRFSVPEELFGPLSLAALEEDRYERRTQGYLPDVEIAFVDEIFKANSAILNALLTLLNEREFDNGHLRQRVPLMSLVAASNELPDDETLGAIADRFLVTLRVNVVSDDAFAALLRGQVGDPLSSRHHAIDALNRSDIQEIQTRAAALSASDDVVALLQHLRASLREQGITLSDRRWRQSLRLMAIAAAACGRNSIRVWDACVLPWCLFAPNVELNLIDDQIAQALGIIDGYVPTKLLDALNALNAQVEIDETATELQFDAGGKLSFAKDATEREATIAAPRLSSALRTRRYGEHHVSGRRAQVDALARDVNAYLSRLVDHRATFESAAETHVWMLPAFAERVRAALAHAQARVGDCAAALSQLRARIDALPRHESNAA